MLTCPFIFDSIKDPGPAVLLGTDFSGGVVLFNQFMYQTRKEHNRVNANMIILGKMIKETGAVNFDDIEVGLKKVIPARKADMIDINLKALKAGYDF